MGAPAVPDDVLVVGFGLTNQAVARALIARGHGVRATDDRPAEVTRTAAADIGVELSEAPTEDELSRLVRGVGAVVPGPGLPDRHPVFSLAEASATTILTEFDLAAAWDDRPIAAITGTDGKTTVTTLVTAMLTEAGIACVDAGNNDLPLVAAIDDPTVEAFVVEASSFRLGRTHAWAPAVATWLNLAPDHLDVHATHADYEAAKARIWAAQDADQVAIGNRDDAADVTQTVFLKAFEHFDRFDERQRFFSWIYRIAINESIDQIKRRSRQEPLEVNPESGSPRPEEHLASRSVSHHVQQVLMELQEDYRAVIILRHFSEYSYQQISVILEIPEKTVKSRLFTARQLMKARLEQRGILPP